MQNCDCKVTLERVDDNVVSFLLVSSNLSYKHNCNFVRADACNISSIQASRYQKMGLRGNNLCGLGFSWDDINCHFHAKIIRQRRITQSVFMAIILLVMSFYYLCLLRLNYCPNLLWGTSSAPWCSPWAKKTDCHVTHHYYCIVTVVDTICYSYLCFPYN